MSDPLGTAVCP